MPWQAGTEPVNVRTGNQGDIGNAQPLKLMRGVDLSPRYHCYLFNISKYGQSIPKGARSYLLNGIGSESPAIEVEIDGQLKLVQYEIGAVIASTVVDTYIDMESKRRIETQDGEEVARDVLFPAIGPNCDNNDLTKWGCGYFKRVPGQHPIPTEAELRPIVEAYDNNMREWLRDADQLATSGQLAMINPIHRRAAAHFQAKRPWNQVVQHPVACPNCGSEIPPGSKFHTLQGTSLLCIIGVEGWKAVVNAGIKSKAEVPDEMRWWTEEAQPTEEATTARRKR